MKRLLPILFVALVNTSYAFQTTMGKMPPEETKPHTNWWWIIGVVIAIGLGMVLYVIIKKNPKKDAT